MITSISALLLCVTPFTQPGLQAQFDLLQYRLRTVESHPELAGRLPSPQNRLQTLSFTEHGHRVLRRDERARGLPWSRKEGLRQQRELRCPGLRQLLHLRRRVASYDLREFSHLNYSFNE